MVGCRGARESEGNERARGEGEGEDGRGCGRGRRRQRLRRRREARGSTHKKPTPCTTMLSKKKMVDETARASRSQRRGLSARLAGRTQGRSVEDAGEERLGLQRVDDLSLADILRLDAGLGEHCGGGERQPKREEGVQGVPRLVQAAREEHSELSWSGRRGRSSGVSHLQTSGRSGRTNHEMMASPIVIMPSTRKILRHVRYGPIESILRMALARRPPTAPARGAQTM